MVSKFCSIFSAFFDNLSILWKLQSFMIEVQSQSRKSVIFTFYSFKLELILKVQLNKHSTVPFLPNTCKKAGIISWNNSMYEGKKEQLNSTTNRPYIVQVCHEGGVWLSGYLSEISSSNPQPSL